MKEKLYSNKNLLYLFIPLVIEQGLEYLVGFAAETQNVEEYAKGKLQRKNLDMIVANDVSQAGAGFNVDTNIAKIITRDGEIKQAPLMQKAELAKLILDTIEEKINK